MKTIRILSLVMLMLTSQRAFAYERARFTLEEAIRYAMKNHPKVLVAENKASKQRESLKSVKMFDPQISFHGGHDMMSGREYFGISVSQDIDSIFEYKSNLARAEYDFENAIHEAELARQDVIANIREAYAGYSSKLNDLKLCVKKLSIERKAFRLADLQFEDGVIPLDSYLSQQKSLDGAGHDARVAKIAFDSSREKLYLAMGYRE